MTFRDSTTAGPRETARFIPARSDAQRLLTCYLEYHEDVVLVHDILHECGADGWSTSISAYPKLRLAPAAVRGPLATAGLRVETR